MDFLIIIVLVSLLGVIFELFENEVIRRIEDSIVFLGLIWYINFIVNEGILVMIVEFELEKNFQEVVSDIRNVIEFIRN